METGSHGVEKGSNSARKAHLLRQMQNHPANTRSYAGAIFKALNQSRAGLHQEGAFYDQSRAIYAQSRALISGRRARQNFGHDLIYGGPSVGGEAVLGGGSTAWY